MGEIAGYCLRSRLISALCLGVVGIAALLPRAGLPFLPVCQFKQLTGFPCFACGLTRCWVAMAHLDFSRAALFHAVGAPLFLVLVGLALLLPLPRSWRESLAARAEKQDRAWNLGAVALLLVFVAYGAARIGLLAVSGWPSPW